MCSLVFTAGAVSTKEHIDINEYERIVERIGEKYSLDIEYDPTSAPTLTPEEFELWLDEIAQIEFQFKEEAKEIDRLQSENDARFSTIPQNLLAASSGSKKLSVIKNSWEIGVTATYAWNSTYQKNYFTGGRSVYVIPGTISAINQGWEFIIKNSSCRVLDGGRTLLVVATGTCYIDGVKFDNAERRAEFAYTLLPN